MAEEPADSNAGKLITELAVPVYNDLLQPAVKEVGKALTTVGKTANLALAPLRGVVWSYEKFENWLAAKVEPHLKKVEQSEIVSPDISVAGPLVEAIKFAIDDEDLSEMYAKLLATSMTQSEKRTAHPSFVQIIGQLTQDEAKIVSHIYKSGPAAIVLPMILDRINQRSKTYRSRISCLPNDAGCVVPTDFQVYLDNLSRLQIVEYFDDAPLSESPKEYDRIEGLDAFKEAFSADTPKDWDLVLAKGYVSLSAFGARFARACIG